MENLYTSYTKVVENKTYYFVKKFMVFPEIPNLEPVLESYGMHTDFKKACSIASVNDPKIMEQLLMEAEGTVHMAKVIGFNTTGISGKILAF